MAGYIFSLNSLESLDWCIENGVYGTKFPKPGNGFWRISHEGTFADYLSMKEGDTIYFFIKRKIYGVGELIKVGDDCKYLNYPASDKPITYKFEDVKSEMLINEDESFIVNRCICTFKPDPNFFELGIDMDDALASNPGKFRMLRAFWKLSFIKIDDEENKALRDIILKRNEKYILGDSGIFRFNNSMHDVIKKKVTKEYTITSERLLEYASNGNLIKHEMALEASLIDYITNNKTQVFGNWDYISHQVVASPFKPIDYMDKMDIFGFRYIARFDTISKYLLIEIKKDKATFDAIDQVMKYCDWINQEYAFGDYSMLSAFLVCSKISNEIVVYRDRICIRNFTIGRRPTVSECWSDVRLIEYTYENEFLKFEEIRAKT